MIIYGKNPTTKKREGREDQKNPSYVEKGSTNHGFKGEKKCKKKRLLSSIEGKSPQGKGARWLPEKGDSHHEGGGGGREKRRRPITSAGREESLVFSSPEPSPGGKKIFSTSIVLPGRGEGRTRGRMGGAKKEKGQAYACSITRQGERISSGFSRRTVTLPMEPSFINHDSSKRG